MPVAVSLMAKSMGITTAELAKQMELGKVYSKDVLPNFGKTLQEWARNNGALDKSLNNLRVQQARMITQTQLSGNIIFQSGWGEGLSDLYKTITEELKELEPLMKSIGRIGGSVFKFAARVVSAFGSILKAVGQALDWITEMTGNWSAALLTITPIISAMFMKLKFASPLLLKLGGGFALLAGKILLVVGALEEVANYITGGKIGILNPEGISLSERITKGIISDNIFGDIGTIIGGGGLDAFNYIKSGNVSQGLAHVLDMPLQINDALLKRTGIKDHFNMPNRTPIGQGTINPASIGITLNVEGFNTADSVDLIKKETEKAVSDTIQGYFGGGAN